jgi:hypothetical protein
MELVNRASSLKAIFMPLRFSINQCLDLGKGEFMRRIRLIISTLAILIAFSVSINSTAETEAKRQTHSQWIAKSLEEMETIKVGMTRADLRKVFGGEGGLSSRTWRQYAYRECGYIKVEIEFEPVGETEPPEFTEGAKDKITKISRPFLERPLFD